uniref:Uncharacterized protein n=1 Tax=Micrurus corallinus TaxID=54390 RepID=A0A2D4G097_MICCO
MRGGWKNTALHYEDPLPLPSDPGVGWSALHVVAHNSCHFCSSECVLSQWNVKSFINFTETYPTCLSSPPPPYLDKHGSRLYFLPEFFFCINLLGKCHLRFCWKF